MKTELHIHPTMRVETKLKKIEAYLQQLRDRRPLMDTQLMLVQELVRDDVDVINLIENISVLKEIWKGTAHKLTPKEREETILKLIQFSPHIRRIDMARMMNVHFTTVKNHLKELEERKVVEFEGPSRGGMWVVGSA